MMTVQWLKHQIQRRAPRLADWLMSTCDRLWLCWTRRQANDREVRQTFSRVLFRAMGGVIAQGPFAGMRITEAAVGSVLCPKLTGCYERELHPIIESIIQAGYDLIFDVGCAEGYYAAGLAWRTIGQPVRILAFDLNPAAITLTRQVAELNGVGARVECHELCDHSTFRLAQGKRSLVFCDIEGGEYDLLDPVRSPWLTSCDIVVEVHDGPDTTRIHDALLTRFADTHSWQSIRVGPRNPSDLGPSARVIPARWRTEAVAEGRRLGLEWLVLRCRESRD